MIYYVPLCFHCSFSSFIPIFCLYSHNSVNFIIGISSMRLNEGSIQISSQMLAKSLKEVPILVLGLIFIEITWGPLRLWSPCIHMMNWYIVEFDWYLWLVTANSTLSWPAVVSIHKHKPNLNNSGLCPFFV